MLSIQPPSSSTAEKTTPNLLPCGIKHNGPIPTSPRYWSPTTSEDGTSTVYFRGRKLQGRTVKVPEGYEGVVLQKTDQILPAQSKQPAKGGALAEQLRRMEEDGDEMEVDLGAEKEAEVKAMETKARFDEVVIWAHEAVPEDEDVYVKGVEEWIGFAEAMHTYDVPSK